MNFLFPTRSVSAMSVMASLAIAFLFAVELNGQVVMRTMTPARAVVVQSSSPVVSAPGSQATPAEAKPGDAAEGEEPKAPEKSFDERRMEALLKANIDRSLPTVLKEWSAKKETEEETKEKAPKKKKPLAAKIANIYEDFVVLDFEKKPPFKKDEKVEVYSDEKLVGSVAILSVEENKVSGKFEVVKAEADEEVEEKATEEPTAEKKPEEAKAEKEAPAAEKAKTEPETAKETEAEEKKADDPETAVSTETPEEPAAETAEAKPWASLKADVSVTVKKPDDGSAKKAAEEAKIKTEVAQWSKIITLGKWDEVKAYLASLKEDDADKLYGHLLSKLSSVPGANEEGGGSRNDRETPLSNFLSPEDILLVTDAAPKPWKISVTGNKKFKGLGKRQVAGKWKGKVTMEGAGIPAGAAMPEITATIDIQLDGTDVSGMIDVSIMGQGQSAEIESGQYDPETGSLTFSATKDGSTMKADLTVEDGTMTGTLADTLDPSGPQMKFDGELIEPAEQPAAEEDDDEDEVAEDDSAGALAVKRKRKRQREASLTSRHLLDWLRNRRKRVSISPHTSRRSKKAHQESAAKIKNRSSLQQTCFSRLV